MKRFKLLFEDDVFYSEIALSYQGEQQSFMFMVDTGASDCCISRKVAEELGFDLDAVTATGPIICAATEMICPKSITVDSFEALGCCEQHFPISVMNFIDDTDGVIGNGFLKRFGNIRFNYPDSAQTASIDVGEGPSGRFGYDVITGILKRVKLMRRA